MGMVLAIITGTFRSLRMAETLLSKEQRQRVCLYRLSREVSSFARIVFPQVRFKGGQEGFFLSSSRRTN